MDGEAESLEQESRKSIALSNIKLLAKGKQGVSYAIAKSKESQTSASDRGECASVWVLLVRVVSDKVCKL